MEWDVINSNTIIENKQTEKFFFMKPNFYLRNSTNPYIIYLLYT